MIYIGVDPGKSGALACIYEDGVVEVVSFETGLYKTIMHGVSDLGSESVRCCIERVSAMPGQGVTSMFTFGQNYGWLLGQLDAYDIPYETVLPKKWKAEFGLTGDKASSVEVCKRLFPKVSLLRSERCRKDDDGMAEALLLAEYARRKM